VRKAMQVLDNLGLTITLDEVQGRSPDELNMALRYLGLPSSVTADLPPSGTTANFIPIVSPRDGVLATRDIVAGEVIDTTKTLFTVVDNHRMWLLLDVPSEEAPYVSVGQRVRFRPDGDPRECEGTIQWMSTQLDAETRTVKVRAELSNDDGRLRDSSLGTGQIVIREEPDAIVVPKDAIHWEGCCYVVFVRDKDFLKQGSYKVFHTRMVRPGLTRGEKTEVIAGLMPGEVVVTKGSGVLRAELLKGNLGPG
jgi:cobalt-zinc-cadmium efflux system membrane fusion protein